MGKASLLPAGKTGLGMTDKWHFVFHIVVRPPRITQVSPVSHREETSHADDTRPADLAATCSARLLRGLRS
jgi:hypothetical protein